MKVNIGNWLLDTLDLPGSSLGSTPRVTVTGNSSVMIENHRGLIEYSRERIAVNGGKGIVSVRGDALELEAMTDSEMLISGRIFSIELE